MVTRGCWLVAAHLIEGGREEEEGTEEKDRRWGKEEGYKVEGGY